MQAVTYTIETKVGNVKTIVLNCVHVAFHFRSVMVY